MIISKSKINIESIETIFQNFMLTNINENYALLIIQYRRNWTGKTINFVEINKTIANYAEITKKKSKFLYSSNFLFQNQKKFDSSSTNFALFSNVLQQIGNNDTFLKNII